MEKLHLEHLDVTNKTALIRVDINVPLDNSGKITDYTRIEAIKPTVDFLLKQHAKIILLSHLGKPKGSVNPKLSLKACLPKLQELFSANIPLITDYDHLDKTQIDKCFQKSPIVLFENLRFHKGEEKPEEDPSFAKKLASFGDVFINDAFGTSHRKHSSTYAITKFFPKTSAMGFLVQKEYDYLTKTLTSPKRPFFSIIGGAKISSKLGVIDSLLDKCDALFIGGAMAFTFLKSQGIKVGKSLIEDSFLQSAKDLLEKGKKLHKQIFLPIDCLSAVSLSNEATPKEIVITDGLEDSSMGLDIGPKTIAFWSQELQKGKTIFWNGPLGAFEYQPFAKGTSSIGKVLSELNATTIVGGGDSLSAIHSLHLQNNFSFLSTGGGASLELIEKGSLPCIEALTDV